MKIAKGIRSQWRALVEQVRQEFRGAAIGPNERGWFTILGQDGGASSTGLKITQNTALKVGTVYDCVAVLSQTIASLPLILYRRLDDDTKERAIDHPLYRMLHSTPNKWQTNVEWFEMLMVNLALRGNGYSEIKIDRRGRVTLEPLRADRVRPVRLKDKSIKYIVRKPEGDTRDVLQANMFHVRNTSIDGLEGLSPITLGSESIGLAMASQQYAAAVFKSGGTKRVALEYPGELSAPAQKRLRQSWDNLYGSPENAGKTAFLELGLKANVVGMSLDDAQRIESDQWSVEDICRWYRMPPHKVGHLLRSTFSNIEHQAIEFVTDTILPWCRRIEAVITRDLIAEDEKDELFAEFNLEGLLRGDSKTRSEFYTKMFNMGIYTINEIRRKENENGVGDDGDKRFIPMNMKELGKESETSPVSPAQSTSTGAMKGIDEIVEIMIADIAERIANAETRELQKHLGKAEIDLDKFKASAEVVYSNHRKYVEKALQPLVDTTALQAEQIPELMENLFRPNRIAIQAITTSETAHELITSWEANRTETICEVLRDAIS